MEGGREVERQMYRQDCVRLPPRAHFLAHPALLAAALSVLQRPSVQDAASLPGVPQPSSSGRLQEGPFLALPATGSAEQGPASQLGFTAGELQLPPSRTSHGIQKQTFGDFFFFFLKTPWAVWSVWLCVKDTNPQNNFIYVSGSCKYWLVKHSQELLQNEGWESKRSKPKKIPKLRFLPQHSVVFAAHLYVLLLFNLYPVRCVGCVMKPKRYCFGKVSICNFLTFEYLIFQPQ